MLPNSLFSHNSNVVVTTNSVYKRTVLVLTTNPSWEQENNTMSNLETTLYITVLDKHENLTKYFVVVRIFLKYH